MPRDKLPEKVLPEVPARTAGTSSERGSDPAKILAGSVDAIAGDYRFTERESNILRAIALGLTTKEIAARMNLSPNTVNALLRSIMSKVGVSTRVELVDQLSKPLLERGDQRDAAVQGDPTGIPDRALETIIDRAIEVIGDRVEAMRWLGTPVRALDFATPISLLATSDGAARVNDVLGQMEHGVW